MGMISAVKAFAGTQKYVSSTQTHRLSGHNASNHPVYCSFNMLLQVLTRKLTDHFVAEAGHWDGTEQQLSFEQRRIRV